MSSESLLAQEGRDNFDFERNFVRKNRTMEARAEHQKTKLFKSLYAFATSMGLGTLTLILFWILHYRNGFAWQSDPNTQFNWHPFLMALGMFFLYSQSILSYRTFRYVAKRRLKLLHAGIHFFAFVFSVIGLKAAFDSHNLKNPPIPNLYTMHSWIGLTTVIVFSAQYVYGFVSFLYPGLSQSYRRMFMPAHVAVGTGGFVMATISVLTGLTEKTVWTVKDYSEYSSEGLMCNFIAIFAVFYALIVLYMVNDDDYKRTPLPEDEMVLSTTN